MGGDRGDKQTDGARGLLRSANLALAFLLELALLAAVGYWGFQVGQNTLLKFVLGLGAPFLVAVFWGVLLAPRSPLRVNEPLYTLLSAAVFAVGTATLAASGHPVPAAALAAAFAINRVLLFVWR
jgi:hypothetical protein